MDQQSYTLVSRLGSIDVSAGRFGSFVFSAKHKMAHDSQDFQGTIWTQNEIDLVVADYFSMRSKFLRGEDFVKADHYRALAKQIGRTVASIEHKYMNISATLERLSLPWLRGYAPLRNFQSALLTAVEQYVKSEWYEEFVPTPSITRLTEPEKLFLHDPPKVAEPLGSKNHELERIARKFDPARRDDQNRKLGKAGEKYVRDHEVSRLESLGRADLAKKVKWISEELGDGAGYDILSYAPDGKERFLEVKTTRGHDRTPFFLSRNEYDFAGEAPDRFRIFRLHDWGTELGAFIIKPLLDSHLILEPSVYRASVR